MGRNNRGKLAASCGSSTDETVAARPMPASCQAIGAVSVASSIIPWGIPVRNVPRTIPWGLAVVASGDAAGQSTADRPPIVRSSTPGPMASARLSCARGGTCRVRLSHP